MEMTAQFALSRINQYVYDHDLKTKPEFVYIICLLEKKANEEKEIEERIRRVEDKAYKRGYFIGKHDFIGKP